MRGFLCAQDYLSLTEGFEGGSSWFSWLCDLVDASVWAGSAFRVTRAKNVPALPAAPSISHTSQLRGSFCLPAGITDALDASSWLKAGTGTRPQQLLADSRALLHFPDLCPTIQSVWPSLGNMRLFRHICLVIKALCVLAATTNGKMYFRPRSYSLLMSELCAGSLLQKWIRPLIILLMAPLVLWTWYSVIKWPDVLKPLDTAGQ